MLCLRRHLFVIEELMERQSHSESFSQSLAPEALVNALLISQTRSYRDQLRELLDLHVGLHACLERWLAEDTDPKLVQVRQGQYRFMEIRAALPEARRDLDFYEASNAAGRHGLSLPSKDLYDFVGNTLKHRMDREADYVWIHSNPTKQYDTWMVQCGRQDSAGKAYFPPYFTHIKSPNGAARFALDLPF